MAKQKTKKLIKNKKENKKLPQTEFEKLVIQMAEKNMTAEKIGEALRKEGIHTKEHGKISKILKAKKIYNIPDIKNIQEKLIRVKAQMEKNAQDKRAMREKDRIFSLLRKNKQYHKIIQ